MCGLKNLRRIGRSTVFLAIRLLLSVRGRASKIALTANSSVAVCELRATNCGRAELSGTEPMPMVVLIIHDCSVFRFTYSKDAVEDKLRGANVGGSKGQSGLFDGTRGNPQGILPLDRVGSVNVNSFPSDNSQMKHMFGSRSGHLSDTPANRELIQDIANNDSCRLGADRWGNEWYARIDDDGGQIWASVRGGLIRNCGKNSAPRPWNDETGLSASEPKRNRFKRR